MNWICSQIGAREHYAVPRALDKTGKLGALYTDFWAGPAVRRAARILPVSRLRSLAGRCHPELDEGQKSEDRRRRVEIVSWNWRALAWEAKGRLNSKSRIPNSEFNNHYWEFIEVGRRFACAVRNRLNRGNPSAHDTLFFGYDTGALEALEWCREHGILCVVDQMDPNRVEVNMVREEEKRWPGWVACATEVPEEYFQRREREWALADRVVVNSEFSRQALIQQGVPSGKLVVIPLCFEESRKQKTEGISPRRGEGENLQPSTRKPLRVLFLGQVVLRKGIQYLMEAAKLLQNEPVHFDVVGPVGISVDAMKSAPASMTFHGRVNRDEAAGWYERSDVFALPTLSDGFALTQLEAMAHGLPVIATPNCGEVVSDGVDGFIVPSRNAVSLAEVIKHYLARPDLLHEQKMAANGKWRQFTLDKLAGRLLSLENKLSGKGENRNFEGLKTESN